MIRWLRNAYFPGIVIFTGSHEMGRLEKLAEILPYYFIFYWWRPFEERFTP
ncbi:hypothetical protein [Peribacillus asahii]|uniref:hypothetical protein n=1 Tax=Peribacillus asahii TaxID=228899 RepID=UPI0037FFF69F